MRFFAEGTVSVRFKCWSSAVEEREGLHSLTCLSYSSVTVVNHKRPLPIRDAERNYDRRRGRVQLIRDKFRRSPSPSRRLLREEGTQDEEPGLEITTRVASYVGGTWSA